LLADTLKVLSVGRFSVEHCWFGAQNDDDDDDDDDLVCDITGTYISRALMSPSVSRPPRSRRSLCCGNVALSTLDLICFVFI
jgi:hypothetical protein